MRAKRVEIAPELLQEQFTAGWTGSNAVRCVRGLPENAEFIRAWYDPRRNVLNLLFRSDDWPDVEMNEEGDEFSLQAVLYHRTES